MPFDVDLHCNTFKFRFWAVYTQAYGGTGAIAPEYAAAKLNADTIDFFFVGPRKRGVRPHPPNPPWLRAWKVTMMTTFLGGDLQKEESVWPPSQNSAQYEQVVEL